MTTLCCVTAWGSDEKQPDQNGQEKKLGERLIRKAITDADEDVMSTVIRLMDEVSHKLEVEFEAGEQTQALQQQVMDRLDEAIKVSAAQLRPRYTTPQPGQGDKRKKPRTEGKPGKEGAGSPGETQEDVSSGATRAGAIDTGAAGSDAGRSDARRAWGHLPPRQRDEVIQGIDEVFLEQYRAWIERYYRALQETEE